MENAIKKALEGGYSLSGYSKSNPKTYIADEKQYELFLDPLFWQALGEQQNWNMESSVHVFGDFAPQEVSAEHIRNWHKFIDHIIEGKSVNSFFEELLK